MVRAKQLQNGATPALPHPEVLISMIQYLFVKIKYWSCPTASQSNLQKLSIYKMWLLMIFICRIKVYILLYDIPKNLPKLDIFQVLISHDTAFIFINKYWFLLYHTPIVKINWMKLDPIYMIFISIIYSYCTGGDPVEFSGSGWSWNLFMVQGTNQISASKSMANICISNDVKINHENIFPGCQS